MPKKIKEKKREIAFAIISFISGLYFLNYRITGQVISNEEAYSNLISFVGIGLLICSFMVVYHIVKKK